MNYEIPLNILKAKYIAQEVVDFRGNPLIEALPKILSPEEAYEAMSKFPDFDEEEAELPTHIRYHMIPRINRFFQPVMQHLDLEQRFSRLIRHGYVGRNPFNKDMVKAFSGGTLIEGTASSMTLMGFSGIGKTSAIERILSLYPQAILHESPLNLIQVVWLKLNCPHDGSLKSLCLDFFLKMDQLIGTNYLEKFGSRKNSISSMIVQMGRVARLHSIGVIVIDEIQHLIVSRDGSSEKMMNFFVTLINEIGVPIMLIGTMRAKVVLQKDFRQARRGSGQGDMVWQQLKKDDDWDLLIESTWKYQWLKNYTPLTKELNETLYEESQGIVDIAIKLFALAQGRAIETGKETITTEIIKKVAKDDLKLVQPMLRALKSGKLEELERYGDIMPMDIEEYLVMRESKIDLRATIQKKKELLATKKDEKADRNIEKIVDMLTKLEIEIDVAEKAATRAIKELGDSSITDIFKYAIEISESMKVRKPKLNKKYNEGLLKIIDIAKQNKVANYEMLLKMNYIKQPIDDFVI